MQSDLEKKLEETAKANPLTKTEKNILWAKIESSVNKINTFEPLIFLNLNPKFIFALLVILTVIGGSVVTVGASDDAGPGDILYPIDIAIERVQLALSKEENKDSLCLKFAQERLKEAQRALAFENGNDLESITISTSTENNFERIRKADKALPNALERLEKTKSVLEKRGNAVAIVAINEIIEELTELAEDHVADLDDIEAEIENNSETKKEINNFRNNLRMKFKIGFSNNGQKGGQGIEKVAVCHIPSGNPDNAHTIQVAEPAVQAHLDHGDYLGVCNHEVQNGNQDNDNDDNNTTSTPDTIAPVISNISSSVSTNTADITWDTDEESDSVVWYSTTTPLIILGDTLFVDSSNLVTTHNISLSGLSDSTTYYFIVSSLDSFGNKATSTELSFTTLTPDTTAPVISNISSSVATNTADIIWNTDEPSNSKAWYSTTTPMVLDSSSFIEFTNLVASHAVSLSNLNASTTYYFIVGSTDQSDNEATSTELSFTTL